LIGRTKEGLNGRLLAVADEKGHSLEVFITAREVSD
jgi:hypothetical protein